jgi:dihydroorotate dehydrogenase (NAD+) catalytic subunit
MIDFLQHYPEAPILAHPFMAAAGVLGFGIHNTTLIEAIGPAVLITPSITLNGHSSATQSMLHEYRGGLIYHEPWHDPGVNWVGRRCTPIWAEWDVPVFVSLNGDDEHVLAALRELDQVEGIAGFEIAFGTVTPDIAERITHIRQRCTMPLLIKLATTDLSIVVPLITHCHAQRIDGITLSGAPAVAHGRLVHPSAIATNLHTIQHISAQCDIPIIACGGVHDVASAQAYQAAGCRMIQVGSWLLRHPQAIQDLVQATPTT